MELDADNERPRRDGCGAITGAGGGSAIVMKSCRTVTSLASVAFVTGMVSPSDPWAWLRSRPVAAVPATSTAAIHLLRVIA